MKRILAILLTVLTLLSATTFGAFTAEAKGTAYTIKKLDKSVSAYGGKLYNYSKYPVFKGRSKGIKKINSSVKSHSKSFVKRAGDADNNRAELNSYYESFGEGNKVSFYNTERCAVTYNKKGIVSVKYRSDWFMGGVHNGDYYGATYKTKTGKKLKLKDVVTKKYNPLKDNGYYNLKFNIYNKLYDKYGEEVAETFNSNYDSGKKLNKLPFYINKKGKVIVCFQTYDISYGAAGCLTVAVPSRYAK